MKIKLILKKINISPVFSQTSVAGRHDRREPGVPATGGLRYSDLRIRTS